MTNKQEAIERIIAKYQAADPSVHYWTQVWANRDPTKFLTLKLSGSILVPEKLDILVPELKALHEYGIVAPIALGGGIQYNAIPGYQDAEVIGGIRNTPDELLPQIIEVGNQNLGHLVNALGKDIAEVVPIGAVKAKPLEFVFDQKAGQYRKIQNVGVPIEIDTIPIEEILHNGKFAVIGHIGITDDGKPININATHIGASVAEHYGSDKLILTGSPILDQNDQVILEINDPYTIPNLIAEGVIQGGMVTNAMAANTHAWRMDHGQGVILSKPSGIEREVFTDGAGTYIRKPFIIRSHTSDRVNKYDLQSRLNNWFAPAWVSPDYFTNPETSEDISIIYTERDKKGISVIRKVDDSYGGTIPYVCKHAVAPEVRGMGLSTQLLDRALKDHGELVLRVYGQNGRKSSFDHYRDNKDPITTHSEQIGVFEVYGFGMSKERFDKVKHNIANMKPTVFR